MTVSQAPIKPLRILILGGTGFIGPHQVEYALSRGHTVTLFNRGKTNPGLFPKVEKLIGDRNAPGGYKALEGRTWDVVIDNPVQVPRWVREAGAVLAPNVGKYVFVSTLRTSKNRGKIGISEADVDLLNAPSAPDATEQSATYGERKVRGEMDAKATFGENKTLIVRPGLIVGPGDLTEFIIRLCEADATGTYNAVGPQHGLTMSEMLYGCKAVTTSDTRFTWVDADFVLERKLRPYADLPVWMPPRGNSAGWARMDISKAVAAGLTFRPLAETARDTLTYFHKQTPERQAQLKAGLPPEKEQQVLTEWRAKQGGKPGNG